MEHELYNSLAALLSYPDDDYDSRRRESLARIGNRQSTIGNELAAFSGSITGMHLHAIQELFIQTFELSPVCSLEMGWHLFGENYDRGLLLVKMRQQLRACALGETAELPDHLTNGLRLLACMERDAGGYFAEAIVLSALDKMLQAIRGKNNPYEHLLEAARLAIREDFPEIPEYLTTNPGDHELRVLA